MSIYSKRAIPKHLLKYFEPAEIGLELSPEEYVAELVAVFREVRRVLRDDGTLWLNLGDSYSGGTRQHTSFRRDRAHVPVPPSYRAFGVAKQLLGMPWRVAFALQADGWYLRQDIIWAKPNPMPESVTDRCTKAHEYLFLLSKSQRYHFDAEAISQPVSRQFWNESVGPAYMKAKDGRLDGGKRQGPGPMNGTRNRRSVWTIATQPFSGAHFAVMPPDLVKPCVLAGCPVGGIVLDPFFGSGTVGMVAEALGRQWIGCELNEQYRPLIEQRTAQLGMGI